MKMITENKILKTITDNHLIKKGDSVLVALSGGADSVALLHALHSLSEKLDISLYACHVNHGIRGMEAKRDADFSEKLAKRLGIPFYLKELDVPEYARKNRISEETAGRKLRYEFFSEVMELENITSVATAHHKNDRAETILMNIIRGTGLNGLKGIEYRNGNKIRPLLDLTKDEILKYCENNGLDYCTDSTNSRIIYRRNKVRHQLIPLLKEFNPDFEECIVRESNIFSADNDCLDKIAKAEYEKSVDEKGINSGYFNNLHIGLKRRIVQQFIAEKKGSMLDISFSDISSVISLCESLKTGSEIMLGGGIKAVSSYGIVNIVKNEEDFEFQYELKPEVPCIVHELGKVYTLVKCHDKRRKLIIGKDDKIILRTRKDGDSFMPTGMNGTKKVKDLLIDKKISRYDRARTPVLTINGEIAMVVGVRDDRRYNGYDGDYVLITENIGEAFH